MLATCAITSAARLADMAAALVVYQAEMNLNVAVSVKRVRRIDASIYASPLTVFSSHGCILSEETSRKNLGPGTTWNIVPATKSSIEQGVKCAGMVTMNESDQVQDRKATGKPHCLHGE